MPAADAQMLVMSVQGKQLLKEAFMYENAKKWR